MLYIFLFQIQIINCSQQRSHYQGDESLDHATRNLFYYQKTNDYCDNAKNVITKRIH